MSARRILAAAALATSLAAGGLTVAGAPASAAGVTSQEINTYLDGCRSQAATYWYWHDRARAAVQPSQDYYSSTIAANFALRAFLDAGCPRSFVGLR